MSEKSMLHNIYIASPCNVKWESMTGDERERMCARCNKKVYNLAQMSKPEAENLLRLGTSVCIRLYRRRDGTIMTDDCPIGMRKIRNGYRLLTKAVVTLIWLAVAVPHGIVRSCWAIVRIKAPCNATLANPPESTPDSAAPKSTSSKGKEAAWKSGANYFMRFPVAGGYAMLDAQKAQLPAYERLVTGIHHLSEREAFVVNGEIYLRTADDAQKKRLRLGSLNSDFEHLDKGMTAEDAFRKAKFNELLMRDKAAELYYKLTLRFIETYESYNQEFKANVIARYSEFLARHGKTAYAETLLEWQKEQVDQAKPFW